jgi:hypothetical protein
VERSTVSKILKNSKKWLAVQEVDINRVAKHRYLSQLVQLLISYS